MKKNWDKVLFVVCGLGLMVMSVKEYWGDKITTFWGWGLCLLLGIVYVIIGICGFRKIWKIRKLKRECYYYICYCCGKRTPDVYPAYNHPEAPPCCFNCLPDNVKEELKRERNND